MLLLSIAILVIIALLNYYTRKAFLHPAVLYPAIWSIQLFGLLIFHDLFIEPSIDAYFVVVAGAILFVVGTYLSNVDIAWGFNIKKYRETRRDLHVFLLSAVVVAICLNGQYDIFVELSAGDVSTGLVYARTLMSVENEDIYGLYKYGNTVALSALLLLQIQLAQKRVGLLRKLLFVYFVITALIMAMLSTGRGPVTFVLLLMGVSYALKHGLNMRVVFGAALFASFVFLVFWVMGSLMGKTEESISAAANDLIAYLFSSIPALSVYIDQQPIQIVGGDGGKNTFRVFAGILASLGAIERPGNLVQEFVPVPHMTNLFTIYLQYLQDYGLLGILIIMPCLGYVHSVIYKWAISGKRDDFAFFVLTISYLPMIQSVFQETYFLSLSIWVQFTLLGLFMTKVYTKGR